MKPIYTCLRCGKKRGGRRGQQYCSDTCRKMSWKKRNWGKYLASQRKSYKLKQKKRTPTTM